ncbi:MAG: glycosyltransferase family 39 protein [Lentisphaeria bacterium]|nr:glycosyltransferase family 39 protein [Lentisphaeria bacterium]
MNPDRLLRRHFGKILCVLNFTLGFLVWFQGSRMGLFSAPRPGMDQYTMLEAAVSMAKEGVLPVPGRYLYSPAYTLFLAALAKLTGGLLPAMRLLQLAVSSLIPWVIFRTSVYAGFGRTSAAVAGTMWIFCGSALLISLDFLRAAPLALCFTALLYFFVRSLRRRKGLCQAAAAGVFAGLCILGRENFIPVVCLPVLFWFIPASKHPDKYGRLALYALCAFLVMSPVLVYNFHHTSSLAILPGNGRNVFEFMQGKDSLASPVRAVAGVIRRMPGTVFAMISPFENPNSLSFYAHREAILTLKVLCLPVTLLFALLFPALLIRSRTILLTELLIGIYFSSLVFCEIYYRFRIPVLPLLCIAGGAGAVRFAGLVKKRSVGALFFLPPLASALWLTAATVPEKMIPRSEREATVGFLLDRRRFDQAGELLLRYRKCGVASPQGERLLVRYLLKHDRREDAAYWHEAFLSERTR